MDGVYGEHEGPNEHSIQHQIDILEVERGNEDEEVNSENSEEVVGVGIV
jgi:hypothetical protein